MKTKEPLGWGWVIFWLIIFWPAGLVLLFKKFNDKTVLMSTAKAPTIAAWVLIALGALTLLTNIEQVLSDFQLAFILLSWVIGGILILLKVRTAKIKAEQYKKYLNVIVNVGERSIDHIANAVSATYEQAQSSIQAMIDDGFLKGAYIHEGNRAVVLSQDIQAEQLARAAASSAPDHPAAPQQLRPITCPGCGANNVVASGKITECAYCQTPLTA